MSKLLLRLTTAFAAVALMVIALTAPTIVAAASEPGGVYTLTNSPAGNAVVAFDRAADGSLTFSGTFATGGLGTGASLASQGAVILSDNGRRLFAVNAGSSEISLFAVNPGGLALLDKVNSGGSNPVSLTVHQNLLFVLNAGAPAHINGFVVSSGGTLSSIAGSDQLLSAAAPGPAQVSFSPDGNVLFVTEKGTSVLDTYTVDAQGMTSGPIITPSSGTTPYGFGFDKRGHAIVSEATTGAVSSYAVADDGTVTVISPSVFATGQNAACWIAISKNGKFAYTANAASHTITGYRIRQNGSLALLDPGAVTAAPGGTPTDMDTSNNSKYLYVLNNGSHAINIYQIEADGNLTHVGDTPGLPAGSLSIAAW